MLTLLYSFLGLISLVVGLLVIALVVILLGLVKVVFMLLPVIVLALILGYPMYLIIGGTIECIKKGKQATFGSWVGFTITILITVGFVSHYAAAALK